MPEDMGCMCALANAYLYFTEEEEKPFTPVGYFRMDLFSYLRDSRYLGDLFASLPFVYTDTELWCGPIKLITQETQDEK